MTRYISIRAICGDRRKRLPMDYGYISVVIYNPNLNRNITNIQNWIIENIEGSWTFWEFGDNHSGGRTYAFLLAEEATLFKLIWAND